MGFSTFKFILYSSLKFEEAGITESKVAAVDKCMCVALIVSHCLTRTLALFWKPSLFKKKEKEKERKKKKRVFPAGLQQPMNAPVFLKTGICLGMYTVSSH